MARRDPFKRDPWKWQHLLFRLRWLLLGWLLYFVLRSIASSLSARNPIRASLAESFDGVHEQLRSHAHGYQRIRRGNDNVVNDDGTSWITAMFENMPSINQREVDSHLTQLVSHSEKGLYDRRTSSDKWRRFWKDKREFDVSLGYQPGAASQQEHIVIFNAFRNPIGLRTVVEFLMRVRTSENNVIESLPSDTGPIVTVVDVVDRSEELNELLIQASDALRARSQSQNSPNDGPDPRKVPSFMVPPRPSVRGHGLDYYKSHARFRFIHADIAHDRNILRRLLGVGRSFFEPDPELDLFGLERDLLTTDQDIYERGDTDSLMRLRGALGHGDRKGIERVTSKKPKIIHTVGRLAKSRLRSRYSAKVTGAFYFQQDANDDFSQLQSILESFSDPSLFSADSRVLHETSLPPWLSIFTHRDHAYLSRARSLVRFHAKAMPLHILVSIVPSFNTIIGDFAIGFKDQPILHLLENALGHLPLRLTPEFVEKSSFPDFTSIDDLAHLAARTAFLLTEAARRPWLDRLAFASHVDIAGPLDLDASTHAWYYFLRRLQTLTKNRSPLDFSGVKGTPGTQESILEETNFRSNARSVSRTLLGYTPKTAPDAALRTMLASVLKRQLKYINEDMKASCGPVPSVPSLERGLSSLSQCSLQLLTVIDGTYHALSCLGQDPSRPLGLAKATSLDPHTIPSVNVSIMRPGQAGDGVFVELSCMSNNNAKPVSWELDRDMPRGSFAFSSDIHPDAHGVSWFKMAVASQEKKTFKLSLPSLQGLDDPDLGELSIVENGNHHATLDFSQKEQGSKPLHWRINPVQCPVHSLHKDSAWRFALEDPIHTSQVLFPSPDGRTTHREATYSLQVCRQLMAMRDRLTIILKDLDYFADMPTPEESDSHSSWSLRNAPVCQTDCNAPVPCIATRKCRCPSTRCGLPNTLQVTSGHESSIVPDAPSDVTQGVFMSQNDLASGRALMSLASLTNEEIQQLNIDKQSLEMRVAQTKLPISPGARSVDLTARPRIHLLDISQEMDLGHLSCEQQKDTSPLDWHLIDAIQASSYPIDQADLVFVPFSRTCYTNPVEALDEMVSHATAILKQENIPESRLVVPMTSAYGICAHDFARLQDALMSPARESMAHAAAWQVYGGTNTRCFRPGIDFVLPPLSANIGELREAFGAINAITPVNERRYRIFFMAAYDESSAILNERVMAAQPLSFSDQENDFEKYLYGRLAPDLSLVRTLGAAQFCLVTRGPHNWTVRIFEALYAGCIPVIIADRQVLPFEDILDYSKFTISLAESHVFNVHDIIDALPPATLASLQIQGIRVRDAFFYDSRDEGPLKYAFASMHSRLQLTYPIS